MLDFIMKLGMYIIKADETYSRKIKSTLSNLKFENGVHFKFLNGNRENCKKRKKFLGRNFLKFLFQSVNDMISLIF